jgi:hypothetical protein
MLQVPAAGGGSRLVWSQHAGRAWEDNKRLFQTSPRRGTSCCATCGYEGRTGGARNCDNQFIEDVHAPWLLHWLFDV